MPRHSRLARLLQLSVGAHLLAASLWAAWRWPASPVQASGGVLLIALIGSIVLGVEGLLSAAISRADGRVAAPSGAQMLRAWFAESTRFFAVFWWRQPFRWRAVEDYVEARCAGRTGVVLVHGFMCNRGFWNPWLRRLQAQGNACVAVNLEPVFASIDAYAPVVEQAVRRIEQVTGRPALLICHSMGGLAARAWWRAHGRGRTVAGLVTVASPHCGTWMGRFSRTPNGRQMRLDSDWLRDLARHETLHPLPATTCWYSNCDNIVFPAATAALEQADKRFIPGQPHVALAFHPQVVDGCMELLRELDTTRQGESVTRAALENS